MQTQTDYFKTIAVPRKQDSEVQARGKSTYLTAFKCYLRWYHSVQKISSMFFNL